MRIKLMILLNLCFIHVVSKAQTFGEVMSASENPFVVSTDITVHSLINDTISLRVYDSYGNLLKQYFNGFVLSGSVTVSFNADTLPNGVYIVHLLKNGTSHSLQLVKNQTLLLSENSSDEHGVSIYPNPTTAHVNISSKHKVVSLKVYDLKGNLLIKQTNNIKGISLMTFPNGVYLFHLRIGEQTFIKKVVKKK